MAKTSAPRDPDKFLKRLEIDSDDPADIAQDERAMFYTCAINADSELRLNLNAGEIVLDVQPKRKIPEVTFFTSYTDLLG